MEDQSVVARGCGDDSLAEYRPVVAANVGGGDGDDSECSSPDMESSDDEEDAADFQSRARPDYQFKIKRAHAGRNLPDLTRQSGIGNAPRVSRVSVVKS